MYIRQNYLNLLYFCRKVVGYFAIATLLAGCAEFEMKSNEKEDSVVVVQVDKSASVADTSTTIEAIERINLVVDDLEAQLQFYSNATGIRPTAVVKVDLLPDERIVYGASKGGFRYSELQTPTANLRIIQFDTPSPVKGQVPANGPGMTHTCFQSVHGSGLYESFKKAGASFVSRGDSLIDMGGYGVLYGYARDPEGNMIELESLDAAVLRSSGYDRNWDNVHDGYWITQAAIATHDIERLMKFYSQVLGFSPGRFGLFEGNPRLDDVAGFDNTKLYGGWFNFGAGVVLEAWQYVNPKTPSSENLQVPHSLGYSFSLQVGDIRKEYKRLQGLGVQTLSAPLKIGDEWIFWARDTDGNLFSMVQPG